MIEVRRFLTADNTDVLDGTDLESIPEDGALAILAASTQNDTTITVTSPVEPSQIRARPLMLRSNGVPSASDDDSIDVLAPGGGKVVIAIDITTAATVGIIVRFLTLEELGVAL